MNLKTPVRLVGQETQQDLTRSTSIQSPLPILQVKIQLKAFLVIGALWLSPPLG
jgi:hypothetical protein